MNVCVSYYVDQFATFRHLTHFSLSSTVLTQLTSGNWQRTLSADDYTQYNWVCISSFAFVSKRRCSTNRVSFLRNSI